MRRYLMFLSLALLVGAAWLALSIGQVDEVVRNIVYFHVPSSICALLCFTVIMVCSIGFLATKKSKWDLVAAAAAEVGLVCATVLNITGSIFAHQQWNVWWTPEPKLITSAILWFLYVAYLILRSSVDSARRRAQLCAVFGIIAFIDVPLVFISARVNPSDNHPGNVSFGTGGQWAAFGLNILAMVALSAVLIWLRYDVLNCKNKMEQQLYS
ncbi:MAG: cytochrome c biogenesis protein CcsA [Planctomycetes bacterium]|nr:cytochrome c biogenesis protein CcsA [Planctomycetota bacterium]